MIAIFADSLTNLNPFQDKEQRKSRLLCRRDKYEELGILIKRKQMISWIEVK